MASYVLPPSASPRGILENPPTNILSSNILQVPFRRSHPVSLSDAITQYISSKYDQRPDMFAEDLLIIDRLRTEAITVQEPHVSGISRLVTYAAQLKWLGGKFPVDVGSPPSLAMRKTIQRRLISFPPVGRGGFPLVSRIWVQYLATQ